LGKNIKKIVAHYIKLYNTNDPFIIAKRLNILVFQMPLGQLSGYYKYLKHHRCIYVNSEIEDENYKTMVIAHELGHAVLHLKENCYFLNSNTFLLTSKIEKQANIFASELLLSDELIQQYDYYTLNQISQISGVDVNLVKLKIERMKGC
jgi:Predicted Zn peptidase